jgi:hypothetical protein
MFLLPKASVMLVAHLLGPIMADGARRYFAEHFGVEVPFPLKVEIKAGLSWGEVQPIVLETQEVTRD